MLLYARPKVVASKCLGFAACRWDGAIIHDEFVKGLGDWADYRPVCPEMEIGLGVPRKPVRLVQAKDGARLMQPATGKDCTGDMTRFVRDYLGPLEEVDGFLLKGRSPTCGPSDVKIYAGPEKGASSSRGQGIFAAAVQARFPFAALEHEGRVKNFQIREHFLTKLFTLAKFRKIKKQMSLRALMGFQAANKLLFMAYNQGELRILGRIAANRENRTLAQVLAEYENHLYKALARGPRSTSNINVLMHGLGYFKTQLKPPEKAYFLDLLDQYRAGRTLLGTLQALLRSWVVRFENQYLAGQSFFAPYPPSLLKLYDSSKGRRAN